MRAEDKQLEGIDLEREEEFQRQHEPEDALLEVAGEEVIDVASDHERRGVLLGAVRAIFARESIRVSGLGLPQREEEALGYLQAAVSGREQLGAFVYATDRRNLLEEALAVLQPNLTNAAPELLAEIGSLDTLTDRLGELRGELTQLEDAQDEIMIGRHIEIETAKVDDPDEPADSTETSLYGEERPTAPAQPSTVDGPELPDEPRLPTSLYDAGDAPPSAAPIPKLVKPIEDAPPAIKPSKPSRGGRG